MKEMYSYTTQTLRNVLENNPDLLDNLVMSTTDRTNNFKDMFKAVYNEKSIGAETVNLFRLWIEDKFNEVKRFYEQKLDIYERELNGDDGKKITRSLAEMNNAQTATTNNLTGSTNDTIDTTNYDLPRTTTPSAKPTTKQSTSEAVQNAQNSTINSSANGSKSVAETITGDVNIIEQREKWLGYIRDIYRDMCKEFKDCFAIIYA